MSKWVSPSITTEYFRGFFDDVLAKAESGIPNKANPANEAAETERNSLLSMTIIWLSILLKLEKPSGLSLRQALPWFCYCELMLVQAQIYSIFIVLPNLTFNNIENNRSDDVHSFMMLSRRTALSISNITC